MHGHELGAWRHEHRFDSGNPAAEQGTRKVVLITLLAMVGELAVGLWSGSMALLADGLHMGSHALAIGLSAAAYLLARRQAADPRYAFGTWKIEVLAGFASALLLLLLALGMVVAAGERLFWPRPVAYREALWVAAIGLAVNAWSALILSSAAGHGGHVHGHAHGHGDGHDHGHRHDHNRDHGHAHAHGPSASTDPNLRGAYLHVLADAATSVLAIVALAGGAWLGWAWLDPAVGVVGALLVALWARSLLADTAKVLLDREMDLPLVQDIRQCIERKGGVGRTLLTDLHVWRVGKGSLACALSVVTHDAALTPAQVRGWLAAHQELVHTTVEVHLCPLPAESD